MMILTWVTLAFILVVSVIDWQIKRIPSIFLTGMLFVVAFITINYSPIALSLGILGFLMALLLYEADFFGGVGDIKVFTMICFLLSSYYYLLAFIVLTLFFGIVWKSIIKLRLKKDKKEDIAFIPVFFFVYLTLILLKGLL